MRRSTAVVIVWLVAAAVSLLLAWKTAVGPVVLVLQRKHHGVHVGDLAGVADCAAWALLLTVVLLGAARRRER
jgi:hypothetical protein